jgi:hypothetical protein
MATTGRLDAIDTMTAPYGSFFILPLLTPDYAYAPAQALARLRGLRAARRGRLERASTAIVVRGQWDGSTTETALRHYAARYPEALLILSTWATMAEPARTVAEGLADVVVTSPAPSAAGVQNRNFQVALATAGLCAARERGVEHVLITRGDLVLTGPNLLESCRQLGAAMPGAPHPGLRERLVISSMFTRKFIPYHPSDLFAFGHVEDLLAWWDVPADTRIFSVLFEATRGIPLITLAEQGIFAETWLAGNLMHRIGYDPCWTLADSWAFYRDAFIVMDHRWFGVVWPKYGIRNLTVTQYPPAACVDEAFWLRLALGTVDEDADAYDITGRGFPSRL